MSTSRRNFLLGTASLLVIGVNETVKAQDKTTNPADSVLDCHRALRAQYIDIETVSSSYPLNANVAYVVYGESTIEDAIIISHQVSHKINHSSLYGRFDVPCPPYDLKQRYI